MNTPAAPSPASETTIAPALRRLGRGVRRVDWVLVLLLCAGVAALWIKVRIARPIEWIGHADAASYANMAEGLLAGRGFSVPYINWYFRDFESLPRPESHWPPFNSVLIAASYLCLGKSAFAAKLPSIVLSCLFAPLLAYALARSIANSKTAGFFAGLDLVAHPVFFNESLRGLSDVAYATCLLAATWFAVVAPRRPRFFVAMGVALALAYYSKGSALIFPPVFFVFGCLRRPKPEPPRRWRWFAAGWIAFGLCLAPWMARNTAHFGHPLYSNQTHVSGYVGLTPWEEGTYRLYLGENLPRLQDRFRPRLKKVAGDAFDQYMGWLFVSSKLAYRPNKAPTIGARVIGAFALIGLAFLAVSSVVGALRVVAIGVWRRWRSKSLYAEAGDLSPPPGRLVAGLDALCRKLVEPWQNPELAFVWALVFVLVAFLSVLWRDIYRLALPAMALTIVAGWVAVGIFYGIVLSFRRGWFLVALVALAPHVMVGYYYWSNLKSIFQKRLSVAIIGASLIAVLLLASYVAGVFHRQRFRQLYLFLLVAILAAGVIIPNAAVIRHDIHKKGYPYRDAKHDWIAAGRWLRDKAPDSITMTRNPWELHFYSGAAAIQIPNASLAEIAHVARHYGATHLIPDGRRPALRPWTRGKVPGLKRVWRQGGVTLYEIDYEKTPDMRAKYKAAREKWRAGAPAPPAPPTSLLDQLGRFWDNAVAQ